MYIRINNSEKGKSEKKKTKLPKFSAKYIKELDETCDFKLHVKSKRPIIDNVELYME